MKKNQMMFIRVSAAILCFLTLLVAASCGKSQQPELWKNATYTEDTALGSGATTVIVKVEAGEKSIELTIKTDRTVLGQALTDNNLVEGENGAYGLMIYVVNGIKADYETDGAYWALYKNGEYATSGADTTEIANGEHYELVYTKG
jgi:hypothetical protein